MFTGIIGALGTVESITPIEGSDAAYLTLNAGDIVADLEHGGSLAVNGVCLTAIDLDRLQSGQFRAYTMGETLRRTNLGDLTPGDTVNLERCLPAGGRFDGHVVQGHVDAVGTLASVTAHEAWSTLRFTLPAELAPLLAEKGSIAVSGVSLTVTAVSEPGESPAWFEVGLIPETLKATNLGTLKVGDSVNLETDALAKYVQRLTAFAGAPQTASEKVAPRRADAASVLDSVQTAVDAIAAGRAVVVVDDEDRENEGDIIFAAEHATPELMGFMIRYTSGVSTGISAADRARTVQILADASSSPVDITRPGHIFPLRAVDGGVAQRPGHTEAAVELSRAAGLSGVGVIAEVVHDDGSMMRFDALRAFATEHNLPMISIEDLIKYVAQNAPTGENA